MYTTVRRQHSQQTIYVQYRNPKPLATGALFDGLQQLSRNTVHDILQIHFGKLLMVVMPCVFRPKRAPIYTPSPRPFPPPLPLPLMRIQGGWTQAFLAPHPLMCVFVRVVAISFRSAQKSCVVLFGTGK